MSDELTMDVPQFDISENKCFAAPQDLSLNAHIMLVERSDKTGVQRGRCQAMCGGELAQGSQVHGGVSQRHVYLSANVAIGMSNFRIKWHDQACSAGLKRFDIQFKLLQPRGKAMLEYVRGLASVLFFIHNRHPEFFRLHQLALRVVAGCNRWYTCYRDG